MLRNPFCWIVFIYLHTYFICQLLFLFQVYFSKNTMSEKEFPFHKILPYFNLFIVTQIILFLSIKMTVAPTFQFRLIFIHTAAWFCFAIFSFYIITWLIRNIDGRYTMAFALLLACFSGYDRNIGDTLCLSRIIVFYPFFLLGYLMPCEKFTSFLEKRQVKIISVLVLLLIIYFVYANHEFLSRFVFLFKGRFPFPKEGFNDIMLPWAVIRAIHIMFAMLMALVFYSVVPSRQLIFSICGRRTVQAYVLHMPILYMCRYLALYVLLTDVFQKFWVGAYIIIILTLSMLLFAGILEKPFKLILHPMLIKSCGVTSSKHHKYNLR